MEIRAHILAVGPYDPAVEGLLEHAHAPARYARATPASTVLAEFGYVDGAIAAGTLAEALGADPQDASTHEVTGAAPDRERLAAIASWARRDGLARFLEAWEALASHGFRLHYRIED